MKLLSKAVLQSMLDEAKQDGRDEVHRDLSYRNRGASRPTFNYEEMELRYLAEKARREEARKAARKLVSISFEHKGQRTTFKTSDTVESLSVRRNETTLVIMLEKFNGSQVVYEYPLARINSEIWKEYK